MINGVKWGHVSDYYRLQQHVRDDGVMCASPSDLLAPL